MQATLSDRISLLALGVAVVDLLIILWDRRPRIRVGAEIELHEDDADDYPSPPVRRLWIDIANHSARRVFISGVSVEWSHYRWLPFGRRTEQLPDLQHWEGEAKVATRRFSIEPWADAVLSADPDDLEYSLTHPKQRGPIWYRILVSDGLGGRYRSRRFRLSVQPPLNPGHRHPKDA